MPRSKQIVLGGKEYSIQQLPMRANREFRDRLAAPVEELMNLLDGNKDLEIGSVSDLAGMIGLAKNLLLGSMDILLEALFAYSPELRADRDRIEADAYDDEAMEALAAVMALAYPLMRAVTALRGGLPVTPMSTNSPLPNGDAGTKQPTAARPKRT